MGTVDKGERICREEINGIWLYRRWKRIEIWLRRGR